MDIEQAANLSGEFLQKYVLDHDFFTPAEALAEMRADPDDDESGLCFVFMRAFPDPQNAGEIILSYARGSTVSRHDPVTQQRAKQCLEALLAAHAELAAFKFRTLISGD